MRDKYEYKENVNDKREYKKKLIEENEYDEKLVGDLFVSKENLIEENEYDEKAVGDLFVSKENLIGKNEYDEKAEDDIPLSIQETGYDDKPLRLLAKKENLKGALPFTCIPKVDNEHEKKLKVDNEHEKKKLKVDDEYKEKLKAEYEHTKKQIKEVTEHQRSIVEDLLTVISDCNKKLLAIAKDLDILHRKATFASVAGSSFGIAGGITTLSGLALASVTLGASLIVTAVGVCVAAGGGIAGASASISNIVNTKRKCSEAENIVKLVNTKLKTFETLCKKQHSLIKALEAMENTGEIADVLRSGGRVVLVGLEFGRLAQLDKLSAVAASGAQLAARGVKIATAVTVGFAALFMVIDAVFLVKGIQELQNDTKTETATEIREYVKAFQKIHQDLKGVAEKIAAIECN